MVGEGSKSVCWEGVRVRGGGRGKGVRGASGPPSQQEEGVTCMVKVLS